MNTGGETRISLEEFHRHFLLTHMKDAAPRVFDEVNQRAQQSGKSFASTLAEWLACKYPQGAFHDDNWYAKDVSLDACYFAHTDFRLHPVPKNERFIDFLPTWRQEIDSGTFPCCLEIRAPWSGPMPAPLAQERVPGKYYVLDGQLRVIRHWYHDVPTVKLYVYRGSKNV